MTRVVRKRTSVISRARPLLASSLVCASRSSPGPPKTNLTGVRNSYEPRYVQINARPFFGSLSLGRLRCHSSVGRNTLLLWWAIGRFRYGEFRSDPECQRAISPSTWQHRRVACLGGGYVRVANEVTGNDENALLGTINQLNAAADDKGELPFVITSISRATGVSERELQAQQDVLRLQFGQLCAINAIARGDSNKVGQIASLKSKGKTWTELATSNGVSIASVEQTTRNANTLTVTAYSNAAERAHGGQDKIWVFIRR